MFALIAIYGTILMCFDLILIMMAIMNARLPG